VKRKKGKEKREKGKVKRKKGKEKKEKGKGKREKGKGKSDYFAKHIFLFSISELSLILCFSFNLVH